MYNLGERRSVFLQKKNNVSKKKICTLCIQDHNRIVTYKNLNISDYSTLEQLREELQKFVYPPHPVNIVLSGWFNSYNYLQQYHILDNKVISNKNHIRFLFGATIQIDVTPADVNLFLPNPIEDSYLDEDDGDVLEAQDDGYVLEVQGDGDVLEAHSFNPTTETFLGRFTRAAQEDYKVSSFTCSDLANSFPTNQSFARAAQAYYKSCCLDLEFLGCYLEELSLLDYSCIRFLPSLVTASVIFLAKFTIQPKEPPWNSTLERYSGYKPSHLKACVMAIHDIQLSKKGREIRDKYKDDKFMRVSTLTSPAEIPTHYFEDVEVMIEFNPITKTLLGRFTRAAQEDYKVSIFTCSDLANSFPTNQSFARAAQAYYKFCCLDLEFLGCYLAELSLLDYSCIRFLPSLVAASLIFLAKFTINPKEPPWNSTLERYSGYKPSHLKACVMAIHDIQLSRKGRAIRDKYKDDKFMCVSTLTSPAEIPTHYFEDVKENVGRLTCGAKKRAAAAVWTSDTSIQPPSKKTRVVLGELTNLSNVAVNSKSDDPQMCAVYASDIYEYLHSMEVKEKWRPHPDYIEIIQKNGVTADMRTNLVDWFVEVAEEYKLGSDTLYLAVSILDRFLSSKSVGILRLQLLGVSCMLIAAKYEEISQVKVKDLHCITDCTNSEKELITMETLVLFCLKFEIGNPTTNTFLGRFTRAALEDYKSSCLDLEFLGCYLAELSLLDYSCIRFLPSLVAASVIFLAKFTIQPKEPPWNSTLERYSGYKSSHLKACVMAIHDIQLSGKGRAIRDKYKDDKFMCVSTLTSPAEIPTHYFVDVEV